MAYKSSNTKLTSKPSINRPSVSMKPSIDDNQLQVGFTPDLQNFIYQNLFFQIPKFGDINSHQYLVVESTEYTNYIENQEQIDALLEEITDLREENLQLNLDLQQVLGAQESIDQLIRQNPNETSSLEDLIQNEFEQGALQGNSSSDNLGTPNPNNTTGVPSSGGTGGGGGGGGQNYTGGNVDEIIPMGQGFDPLVQTGFGRPNNNLQQNNY